MTVSTRALFVDTAWSPDGRAPHPRRAFSTTLPHPFASARVGRPDYGPRLVEKPHPVGGLFLAALVQGPFQGLGRSGRSSGQKLRASSGFSEAGELRSRAGRRVLFTGNGETPPLACVARLGTTAPSSSFLRPVMTQPSVPDIATL